MTQYNNLLLKNKVETKCIAGALLVCCQEIEREFLIFGLKKIIFS